MEFANTPPGRDAVTPAAKNLALFADLRDGAFVKNAFRELENRGSLALMTDNEALVAWLEPARHVVCSEVAAGEHTVRLDHVQKRLSEIAEHASLIAVDVTGWLNSVYSAGQLDGWGHVCDRLCREVGLTVVSIYDTNLMIEDHFLAALRSHSHFLAPTGTYPNPYWIPPSVERVGTLTDQISYVLGKIVPDYQDVDFRLSVDRDAASGADPRWIGQTRRVQPRLSGSEGWKICCLGRLRIYAAGGDQLRWDIPGGAPKKSRALFAFLLQRGERGARATQLAELLWPDEGDEEVKRKRLHHAIAMLRRTLGNKDHVRRMGEYYVLNPPANTWIDITSFEQLCNRAKFMTEDGQDERAMALLDTADRLYAGDLFEDLEAEFVETDVDDWLLPRRVWLRDMAIKVQMFKAGIYHRNGQLREALDSCQTALSMDPLSEAANGMAMQIFHDQGRTQAVTRQYRQYQSSLSRIDADDDASDLADLHRRLTQGS